MEFYTILFIGITVMVLLALTGFFFFVLWLDKKIDKKDRLGRTLYNKEKNNE